MSNDSNIKWADILSNLRYFLLLAIIFIVVVEIAMPLIEAVGKNKDRTYMICFSQEEGNTSTNGCYCSELNSTNCNEFMEVMGYSQKEAKV